MADGHYCVVVEIGTGNVLVAKKRKKARYPGRGYDIAHNPGQHVFPGGDDAALNEFHQETGVDLQEYPISKLHEEFFSTRKGHQYQATFVLLEADHFNQVFNIVRENLVLGPEEKKGFVQDDELDSIACMSVNNAIGLFRKNARDKNEHMNTSWFYNICIYLEEYLAELEENSY